MAAPLRVGLAGLGTVGSAVAGQITRARNDLIERAGRPIELVAYASKDPPKDSSLDLSKARKAADPLLLARDPEIDVFVELMGGDGDPAKSSVEAAVAGGIPIVKTLREGLGGSRIARVYGILNGTCNYILTRMHEERLSFADCLKEAQRLGYAEANPTFDIGGFDTAHKLAILTSLAFGSEVDAEAVHVEGIESITLADLDAADELGYRVKLLGVAQRTQAGIEQRVHPTMVRKGSVIAGVNGVTNAVAIDADTMELTLIGPGAGGAATASSVVADLIDLAAERRMPAFGRSAAGMSKPSRAPMQRHEGGYYIRLSAVDRPGTVAAIATRLAEQNISLESIVQRHRGAHGGEDPDKSTGPVPVILITYATTEAAVRKALSAVEADGAIAEPPQLIRIEKHR